MINMYDNLDPAVNPLACAVRDNMKAENAKIRRLIDEVAVPVFERLERGSNTRLQVRQMSRDALDQLRSPIVCHSSPK